MSWKSGRLNLLEPSGPHRACYGAPYLRCRVALRNLAQGQAGRFLGLCVRIPPRPGNVVSVESCDMQFFTTGPSPVQESPTDCVLCVCVYVCVTEYDQVSQ